MNLSRFSDPLESFRPSAEQKVAPAADVPGVSGRSFWIGLLLVGLVCSGMYFYRLGDWPWDVDELSSLEEMGLLDPEIRSLQHPPDSIVVRLPRLVPVWYGVQKSLLRGLPQTEWGSRVLSAVCAAAAVMALYGWGWRWRGTRFAAALAILSGGSLLMVWLAQQNRFYTMALLWIVLAMAAIWAQSKHWAWGATAAGLTLLAVLTHNVAIVLFGLQAVAAATAWILGWSRPACAIRALLTGAIAAGMYLFHVRPIAGSWTGVGLSWAPPWASFVAHVGMPTVVLALVGSVLALLAAPQRRQMAVWAGLTLGVLLFVLLVPWLMPVWNPRYSLLWVLPLWVTGAFAVETMVAALIRWASAGPADWAESSGSIGSGESEAGATWESTGTQPSLALSAGGADTARRDKAGRFLPGLLMLCCYGGLVLLLSPKWLSHWIDGTRHDYRQAADFVANFSQHFLPEKPSTGQPPRAAAPRIPILTNMELQMRYYLPKEFRSACRYWAPPMALPEGSCVVVLGGNGWEEPFHVPGRTVQWIGLVGRRRFDELAHAIRIYWVGPGQPIQHADDSRSRLPP